MTVRDLNAVRHVLANYMHNKQYIVSAEQLLVDDSLPNCEVASAPRASAYSDVATRLLPASALALSSADVERATAADAEEAWLFTLRYVLDIEGLVGETVLLVSMTFSECYNHIEFSWERNVMVWMVDCVSQLTSESSPLYLAWPGNETIANAENVYIPEPIIAWSGGGRCQCGALRIIVMHGS
jgi:hypothetical protein